jgi:hypothetical protein
MQRRSGPHEGPGAVVTRRGRRNGDAHTRASPVQRWRDRSTARNACAHTVVNGQGAPMAGGGGSTGRSTHKTRRATAATSWLKTTNAPWVSPGAGARPRTRKAAHTRCSLATPARHSSEPTHTSSREGGGKTSGSGVKWGSSQQRAAKRQPTGRKRHWLTPTQSLPRCTRGTAPT